MRHKGFTVVEFAIVIFIVCIIAAILMPPGVGRSRHNARRASCQSNLKQIGLAFMQYTQDAEETFPFAILNDVASSPEPFSTPFGWADAIYPYLKSTSIFQCAAGESMTGATDATQPGFTDYWMNSKFSNLKLYQIQPSSQTILAGDGNDGTEETNARYNIGAMPDAWRTDQSKPSFRHLETANYLFADGHVKAMRVNRIQNKMNQIGAPTFAIK